VAGFDFARIIQRSWAFVTPEASMSYDSGDLEDERHGILKWLFDVAFGRREDPDDEEGDKIHRLGTLNRLLSDD
jgi:hypothetical protein